MEEKEKEFIEHINIDKAHKKTIIVIAISILNVLTYIIPMLLGDFDFGFIFEILTLIFIFISKKHMINYNVDKSKKYMILAMIPIGWITIYDIITIFTAILNDIYFIEIGIDFLLLEFLSLINIVIMIRIYKDLLKADNPQKYKNSTDWFYEKNEEKK